MRHSYCQEAKTVPLSFLRAFTEILYHIIKYLQNLIEEMACKSSFITVDNYENLPDNSKQNLGNVEQTSETNRQKSLLNIKREKNTFKCFCESLLLSNQRICFLTLMSFFVQ